MQINNRIYNNFCSNINLNNPNTAITDREPIKKGLNLPVLAASTAGVIIPLIFMARKQGGSLLKLKPFKLMDFDLNKDKKLLQRIFTISAGSITGGFLGGAIKDKGKNLKEKVKEANYQFIGNIASPMILVTALSALATKYVPKNLGKFKHMGAKFGAIVLGLSGGVAIGSTISKFINDKIIDKGQKFERKVHGKDLIYHVDDVLSAAAISTSNTPIVETINASSSSSGVAGIPIFESLGKFIPLFLISAGYQTGNK